MMRYIISLIFWSTLSLSWAAPLVTLNNIVIFGDSLSDSGNLYEFMHHQIPKSPPYYQGHFSNGLIWAEYLRPLVFPASQSENTLLNYAYGGAGVMTTDEEDDVLFTFNREIDMYLHDHNGKADPNSLFIVWMGANNYLGLPEDIDTATEEVRQGLQKGAEKLLRAGAHYVTFINLPDMGKTPFARSIEGEQPFHELTLLHNKKLTELVEALQQQHPEATWLYFDVYDAFEDIFSHLNDYPFDNISHNCQDAEMKPHTPFPVLTMATSVKTPVHPLENNCQKFFFFDLVHPTTYVHELLAQRLHKLFKTHNITFIPH